MAEIISSGNTEAASGDIVLAEGESATIFMRRDATIGTRAAQAIALVQVKGSDDNWTTIGRLDDREPLKVLSAVGTFRVQRVASDISFAVDKS